MKSACASVISAALVAFAASGAQAQAGFGQFEEFTTDWTDTPVTKISRSELEKVEVTFASGTKLKLSRRFPAVAISAGCCTAIAESFFSSWPALGKAAKGLNLGPNNTNTFGCQFVVVITLVEGEWSNWTATQILSGFLLHLSKKGDGEVCFVPVPGSAGASLPRLDGPNATTQPGAAAFQQVSDNVLVYADTPRVNAFDVGDGFPIGQGGDPEPRTMKPGDTLELTRNFITFFFATCTPPRDCPEGGFANALVFFVRWCCAHRMIVAALAADWVGESIVCDPANGPRAFAAPGFGVPETTLEAAKELLEQAQTNGAFSLTLNESVKTASCPHGK